MAYLTADNTPLPVQREALYPTGTTGGISSGNTATIFSIALGSLALSGIAALFDAQTATVIISNNGTAKTINAATLTFSDTVGAQTPSISYSFSAISITSGTSQVATVALNNGVMKNASLLITFASAPTAGSADVQATLQSGGGSSGGGGSSDVTIHDNSTPSYHLRINSDGSINTTGSAATSVALNDGTATSQKATVDTHGNLRANVVGGAGTNKLAIDASGRLTLVPDSSINIDQWGGAAVNATNPVITADHLRAWIYSGSGFMATTGKQTAGSSGNFPINLWIPAGTARTVLIYSARGAVSNAGIHVFTQNTLNPAYATSFTPLNMCGESSVTSLLTASYATTTQSVNGTHLDAPYGTQIEVFANGAILCIPPNLSAGIGFTLYVAASNTNNYSGAIRWVEF